MNNVLSSDAFAELLGYVLTTRFTYWAELGLTYATPSMEIEIGEKFARVTYCELYKDAAEPSHHSAVAFIALCEFENKGLGKVRAGDVFKSASYKAPAKHARGNIYDESGVDCWGWHGPHYLRG